jgi:hypothetical protein
LLDSYWVQHQVTITDDDTPVSVQDKSSIVASTPTQAAAVTEGEAAIASYSLDSPLAAAATVNVSAPGWFAMAGEDYNLASLQYRTQKSGHWSDWALVADGSDVSLAAGTAGLELKVDTFDDGVAESLETLTFVVRQTTWDSALEHSWWISQSIALEDAVTPPVMQALVLVGI